MKRITKIEQGQPFGFQKKPMVAAYARVSTSGKDQLLSLAVQKEHYEDYIRSNSEWDYAGLYVDEGISGTKMKKRTGLLDLLEDCENGKVNMIITKSISRFARNTTECLETVRRLKELNIPIIFEKENIDTSKMENEFLLTILASMAETESVSISQNSKWSIKKRFENGTFVISYPPYGYANVDGEMVIVPEQAEIVKRIFDEALNGSGSHAIAKRLQQEEIPTRRGGKWTAGTVGGMLKNEKYTGDVYFQKTFTDESFTRHNNHGEENMYLAKEHHEAIVSHEVFDNVQQMLEQRGKEKGIKSGASKYQIRYALSGKIRCGECGSTFKRRTHYTSGGDYIAWSCNRHIEDKKACKMLYITDKAVKDAFIIMMEKLAATHKTLLKPFVEELKGTNDRALLRKVKQLDDALEKNQEQQQVLVGLMTSSILEPAVFTKEQNQLITEAEALAQEKNLIAGNVNKHLKQAAEAEKLIKFVAKGAPDEFDDEVFTEFVDEIVVLSRAVALFKMKCGLQLEERLVN